MSATTYPVQTKPQNLFLRLMYDEPRFTATALFLCVLAVPTLLAMAMDTRQFQGDSPWLKPFKFQLALIIYLATLSFYAGFLPSGLTMMRNYRIFSGIVALCVVLEMIWITGAASFATASHYNDTNAMMAVIYPVMGVLATILTLASLVYGLAIWRDKNSRLDPPMQRAVSLGLILTFILTILTAGTLSSGSGHFVGVPVTDVRLPILGWSGEVGDLRVAHFFATHAMHAIPLIALILPASLATSWGISFGYTALTLAVFTQALLGLPVMAL